jgi:hypothetical protein
MKDIKKKKQEVAAKFIKIYIGESLDLWLGTLENVKSEPQLFKIFRVIPI